MWILNTATCDEEVDSLEVGLIFFQEIFRAREQIRLQEEVENQR